MSRIYKHGHYPSDLTMDKVNDIVDVIETYLCNYKLGFHLVYQKTHLIRMDVCKLNSRSVSLNDMIQENEKRGYNYV